MSQAILISDLHIYDYPAYNIVPNYRLDQPLIMVDLVIEEAKKHGIKNIFILGDISEHSTVSSVVEHRIKEVLHKLGDYFECGYYILGQHDMQAKTTEIKFTDSFIHLIMPSHFHYMDRKEMYIENTRIGFENWRPGDVDLDWYEGTLDLYCGHVTNTDSSLFGQYIDKTRFKQGACGDIHQAGWKGNLFNLGTPMQNKMGDQIRSTGAIFDFTTQTLTPVDFDPDLTKLFHMEYTDQEDQVGFFGDLPESPNRMKIYRPAKLMNLDMDVTTVSVVDWEDLAELIEKLMVTNELEDLHKDLLQTAVIEDVLDLDFRILEFTVTNYRSLGSVTITLNKGEKFLVNGENGSGKSSFMNALRDWMFGNRFLGDEITHDEEDICLRGKVFWSGSIYEWWRGNRSWGLIINDEPQSYNSKKAFEEDLMERLPFLEYEDIIYYKSHDRDPFGRLLPERKSELIQKFMKLDKVKALNDRAKELLAQEFEELEEIQGEVSDFERSEREKNTELEKYADKVGVPEELDKEVLRLGDTKTVATELKNKIDNKAKLVKSIAESKVELKNLDDSVIGLDATVIKNELATLKLETEATQKLIESYTAWETYIRATDKTINENKIEITAKKLNLEKVEDKKCFTCDSVIDKENTVKLTKELTDRINLLETSNSNLTASKQGLTLEGVILSKTQNETVKSGQKTRKSTLDSNETKLTSLAPLKTKLESLIKTAELEVEKIGVLGEVEDTSKVDETILELINLKVAVTNKLRLEGEIADILVKLGAKRLEEGVKAEKLARYKKYVKLTSNTGEICKEILTRVAEGLTTEDFRYVVMEYTYRCNDMLVLEMFMRVKSKWNKYNSLSDGQSIVAGMHFFCNVFKGTGLVILDEALKHLDLRYLTLVSDWLRDHNTNNMLISTHDPRFNVYNRILNFELDEVGLSKYRIE